MTEWTNRAGAFLFGRKTYEIFAGSWPKSTDPADEIANALNTRPKFVASRTLHKVDWSNSSLLKGDVARRRAPGTGTDTVVLVHGQQTAEGLLEWLLACPEKGYFVPIESESTGTLRRRCDPGQL